VTQPLVTADAASRPLVVANCSGFYGDRLAAMHEVLTGGPLDVVTGDYLAELTMLILGRARAKDPTAGFARTFLTQLEECLALIVDGGVKVVVNAGGLNPAGLADAVRKLAAGLGVPVSVATVAGDDLLARMDDLTGRGVLRTGDAAPGDAAPAGALTANAYLGCWGIVRALDTGADIVVTGRVTDASLVVGPAAWHHGWSAGDLDALAGATVAGHVLECGAQATGGNFSLFTDLLARDPGALDHVGFPLAEVAADGSCVVTKHPGTGGAVSVATVTEQLLYECTGARYGGPDVITRFDTLRLEQAGPDRVSITGAVGLPPGRYLKVATNRLGGWRNTMTLPLTGLDIGAKAQVLRRQLESVLAGIADVSVSLARTDHADSPVQEEAAAALRVTVKDASRERVGRAFTGPLVELGLASIPGFHSTAAPPAPSAYGVYAAAWVPADEVPAVVTADDGSVETVSSTAEHAEPDPAESVNGAQGASGSTPDAPAPEQVPLSVPTRRAPLGSVAGARSGDKGGSATLGVYARDDAGYRWLAGFLTGERLAELLPETAGLPVSRELLPNLRAVLFQLPGLLGEGVAGGTRFDAQAKALGEWLRSRVVDVPEVLLQRAPAR